MDNPCVKMISCAPESQIENPFGSERWILFQTLTLISQNLKHYLLSCICPVKKFVIVIDFCTLFAGVGHICTESVSYLRISPLPFYCFSELNIGNQIFTVNILYSWPFTALCLKSQSICNLSSIWVFSPPF